MSKKIMRKSLALGALMAFVITGSAMAADYENQTFKDGTAVNYSGAFNGIQYGPITIENCTFTNNVASHSSSYAYGGAIYAIGDLSVVGSTFTSNVAQTGGGTKFAHGGAISHQNGNLIVDDCTFNGNKVLNSTSNDSYGSAIYVSNNGTYNASVTITNSRFFNQEGGRAIYLNSQTTQETVATVSGNTFENNKRGCIQTDVATAQVILEGENSFIDNDGDVIKNKGVTNFAEGSTTKFSGNELDIDNQGTMNIEKDSIVTLGSGMEGAGTTNINGGTVEFGANSYIGKLGGTGGEMIVGATNDGIAKVDIGEVLDTAGDMNVSGNKDVSDYLAKNGDDAVEEFVNSVTTTNGGSIDSDGVMTTEEGTVGGAYTIRVTEDGIVAEQAVNTKSDAVSDAGMTLKGHWRAHMNDMNKRMGELRMANGEHGVWTRMVRGESEYQGAKMQYNQYQLGYDEKLSVDKRWTVGAAVTFSEGDSSYGSGSTDDKSTAFAIYGSKLNNDGTFVDLIARYAHLESDLDDRNYGTGDYSTNGMSVSAEFGKRIQQGNGLWIEPQVELTYGSVDSADVAFDGGAYKAHYDSMDSFIARAGFALGKDIKQGNVYARASYLYDFDGETETQFEGGKAISEDFGGGWWEVGVGANINLSKATYIYADIEKTFGGEVDTNWQWNLGVRYSF